MVRRYVAAALVLSLSAAGSLAQSTAPVPLFPTPPPESFRSQPPPSPFGVEPLPPVRPAPDVAAPSGQQPPVALRGAAAPPAPDGPPPGGSTDGTPDTARVFCEQPVTVRIADREWLPERYRGFVGIWSDAAWTPQLCAALIVEDVAAEGTARIVYAFGPLGPNARVPAGVLRGTGIIRDGELRFQNADGSQFAFRPVYSDLEGQLVTPQGQRHQAVFKKTL